jgi:hypothetical protein
MIGGGSPAYVWVGGGDLYVFSVTEDRQTILVCVYRVLLVRHTVC